MVNILYLMMLLISFDGFADNISGSGPPPTTLMSFGELCYGASSMNNSQGQNINCSLIESQLVIESQHTSERLALNASVISSKSGGFVGGGPPGPGGLIQAIDGTSETGVITKKMQIAGALDPKSFSKLKIFTENNEDLLFIGDSGELEAPIVNFYSEPGQLEFILENAVIKFIPIKASESGGGGTPTITDADIVLYGSIDSTGGIGGSGPPMAMVDDDFAGGGSIAKLCDLFASGGSIAGGGTIGDKGGISGGRGVLLEDEEGGSTAVEGGLK